MRRHKSKNAIGLVKISLARRRDRECPLTQLPFEAIAYNELIPFVEDPHCSPTSN